MRIRDPQPRRAYRLPERLKKKVSEKWGEKDVVNPSEKGKHKGKTKADLCKQKAAGRGDPKELNFAIRAKSGWGKVEC